jgi:hypothetical protein
MKTFSKKVCEKQSEDRDMNMKRLKIVGISFCLLIGVYMNPLLAQRKEVPELRVFTIDASNHQGTFKPINRVNGGPRIDLGNYFDNGEYFKAMAPPYV